MIIDFGTRTVQSKMVFYGCAMSGKTTALQALYQHFNSRGLQIEPLVSIETSHEKDRRTLFYDFGTFNLKFGIWKMKLNFWTATGQDFYCATRTTVLQGTDGIIFVADSQESLFEENLKSWSELKAIFGSRLENIIPVVVCLNKRDLSNKITTESLKETLGLIQSTPIYETIATTNQNVYPAFKSLLEKIFQVHRSAKITIMKQLKDYSNVKSVLKNIEL